MKLKKLNLVMSDNILKNKLDKHQTISKDKNYTIESKIGKDLI